MPLNVEVVVVGDPSRPLSMGHQLPEDMDVPYELLRKVDLDVDEDETLGAVLTRACELIGVEPAWEAPVIDGIGFIDFYREGRRPLLGHEVTILDIDGHVKWVHRWKQVTYAELVRAGEAGVLVGDPRRPYLFLQPEIGNGFVVTLLVLYGAWKVFWGVVDDLERARDLANAAGRLFRGRTREVGEVIDTYYEVWQRNGARPDNLARFLGEHEWSLEHLADFLGCTTEQAEALLLGFGHERGQDGRWRPGGTEEAKFLRDTAQVLSIGGAWAEDDLEKVLSERIERFLESGAAPDIDWEQLMGVQHDPARLAEVNEQLRAMYEQREEG